MTLIVREEDVRDTLTMLDTMRVVEAMFRRQGEGEVSTSRACASCCRRDAG